MVKRPVSILLLAAGASRRMVGRDKLMERVHGGVPLITDRAKACIAANPHEVLVMLRVQDMTRSAALGGLALRRVPVVNAAAGMSASIKTGLAAVSPQTEGVLVVLADMPDLTAEDFASMIAAFQSSPPEVILRGSTEDNQPGHPVLFGRAHFNALAQITGDTGAKIFLATHQAEVQHIPLPANHALTDLDTAQDWARWRQFR